MSLTTLGQPNPKDSILLFDLFLVDETLPKFQKGAEEAPEDQEEQSKVNYLGAGRIRLMSRKARINVVSPGWGESIDDNPPRSKRWRNLWPKLAFWNRPPKPVPVQQVFTLVLSNPEEIQLLEERNLAFETMLDIAQKAGQTSLAKQLETERSVRLLENVLYVQGMKRYISEAQILRFVENCEKGLCLDWVAKFVRPIPAAVVQAKVKCDEMGLFDNYCVLHYDPDNKGTTKQDRAEEAARRRDPILFGVIENSRKLYFVGDWVDQYCDLTFEQIVEKLGEGSLELV